MVLIDNTVTSQIKNVTFRRFAGISKRLVHGNGQDFHFAITVEVTSVIEFWLNAFPVVSIRIYSRKIISSSIEFRKTRIQIRPIDMKNNLVVVAYHRVVDFYNIFFLFSLQIRTYNIHKTFFCKQIRHRRCPTVFQTGIQENLFFTCIHIIKPVLRVPKHSRITVVLPVRIQIRKRNQAIRTTVVIKFPLGDFYHAGIIRYIPFIQLGRTFCVIGGNIASAIIKQQRII